MPTSLRRTKIEHLAELETKQALNLDRDNAETRFNAILTYERMGNEEITQVISRSPLQQLIGCHFAGRIWRTWPRFSLIIVVESKNKLKKETCLTWERKTQDHGAPEAAQAQDLSATVDQPELSYRP